LTFGAGLGWREAQRKGLGMARVHNKQKAAGPLPIQPREFFWRVNPHPTTGL
jgi:hypothetical protein